MEPFAVTPDPVEAVRRPVMVHRWGSLTFLHWAFEPSAVQPLLPRGLEVDTREGAAYVGLIPFLMRIRLARGPFVPWVSTFPETNVRTYVRGPDGRRGIWFFTLDVPRLGAVGVARTTYRIPYCWSRMRFARTGGVVTASSRRRWPSPRWARSDIAVDVGTPYAESEVSDLEHFLTARWGLYSMLRGGLAYAPVEHPRWPLRRSRVLHLDESLVEAAGLPAPAGAPLVHFSPGVEVLIGAPRLVSGHESRHDSPRRD
jgi:uncharacterized protein YqjF (DUF2071 family)